MVIKIDNVYVNLNTVAFIDKPYLSYDNLSIAFKLHFLNEEYYNVIYRISDEDELYVKINIIRDNIAKIMNDNNKVINLDTPINLIKNVDKNKK